MLQHLTQARKQYGNVSKETSSLSPLEQFQQCSIQKMLGTGLSFLNTAVPLSLEDFEERRDRLAHALVTESVDAFVVEPGYTFKYYGNVSQPEWEVWEVCGHSHFAPLVCHFPKCSQEC